MNKKHYVLIVLLWSIVTVFAQENRDEYVSDKLYLGQRAPGLTPEIFAPGIISTKDFEFSGTFSMDGKEYFFTRRPTYEGMENRILYTQLLDNEWTEPVLAPFAKDAFEFEPVFSAIENKVYFYSERSESRDDRYDGDLWVSEKLSSGWGEATYFLSIVNKKWCMSVSQSKNGNLYFSSNYQGKRGIFKAATKNSQYPEVEYLPEEINANFFSHPFIAPDESYMIMDAQLTGRGKPELFISFKEVNGEWSIPKNMGPLINTTKTEFGASVSPDGKYLFFHRRVNGNGDIYWVDAKVIEKLKIEK